MQHCELQIYHKHLFRSRILQKQCLLYESVLIAEVIRADSFDRFWGIAKERKESIDSMR